MSWMDSWSRPSKSQAAPPPFYLTQPDAKYCHTCGRIIGARRANTSKASASSVKYCSDKCKKRKPSTSPESLDVRIESALGALLEGLEPPPPLASGEPGLRDTKDKDGEVVRADGKRVAKVAKKAPKKGDPRVIVQLSEVEEAVFGKRQDPEKTYGRRRNRAFRGVKEDGEWKSVDMVDAPASTVHARAELAHNDKITDDDDDDDDTAGSLTAESTADSDENLGPTNTGDGGVSLAAPRLPLPGLHVRPSQTDSEINFSAGGGERGHSEKITETPEMLAKRREGQKRAEEKELVRCVFRRAVVFGLALEGQGGKENGRKDGKAGKKNKSGAFDEADGGGAVRRKCEALMSGSVVEPSFAKGDWSVRWRED